MSRQLSYFIKESHLLLCTQNVRIQSEFFACGQFYLGSWSDLIERGEVEDYFVLFIGVRHQTDCGLAVGIKQRKEDLSNKLRTTLKC